MNPAIRTAALLAVCGCLCWAILTAPGRIERLLKPTADRLAALVGETVPDDKGEPFTIARLVESADGTALLVRPVLRESAASVKAARQPLSEAARTIRAARPVLAAAKDAVIAAWRARDATKLGPRLVELAAAVKAHLGK